MSLLSSISARLDRGAERDDLVGVDALARLEAEELGDLAAGQRHARHAADEDDVLEVRLVEAGVSSSVFSQISIVRSIRSSVSSSSCCA
jgi:hypothetical protein